MSDSYNANIYLKPSDLNNIEDRIEELTEECQERIFGKDDTTYSGTDFQIDTHDVIQGDLTQIDGQTEQTTTQTGKNLLPPTIATATQSGITLTNNVDGSYTLNGTATANYTFSIDLPITLNGTYSISCNNSQTSSGVSFRILDSSSSSLVSITLSSANTIRENVSITNGTKQAIRVSSGTTLTNFILQPQLEEGSSVSPYEPYIPNSPSPDYPQPVNVVSGSQVVRVCGKNLLNIKSGDYSYGTSTWEVENQVISLTRTDTTYQGGALSLITGATGRWASSSPTDNNVTRNGGQYTYTILRNGSISNVGTNGNIYVYMYIYKNDGTSRYAAINVDKTGESSTTAYSLTLADDEHIGDVILYSQFIECTNVEFKIMLEIGYPPTTYEEYKGTDYEINLGKNLFYINDCSLSQNGGVVSVSNGNTITITGTFSTGTNFSFDSYVNFTNANTQLGNAITLSVQNIVNQGTTSITPNRFFLGSVDTLLYMQPNQTTGIITKTLGETLNRCRLYVPEGTYNTTFNVQLEKGSSASSYSPYKTPIYLGKIGTYQDYIFRNTTENPLYDSNLEEGQWYIHKEIGRVVLTGASSENWGYSNSIFNTGSSLHKYIGSTITTISNYFKGGYNKQSATNYYNGNDDNTIGFNRNNILIRDDSITSSSAFKTWLSTHNVEVYYVLNTPTNTLIEDEELINQLESIQLINGLNNIRVTSSNLSGSITIQSYLASFYRNIEVDDDLGGKTLYLSLPRTIHESIPDTDTSSHPLINMDGDAYIVYRYVGGYKYIGVRLPDPDNPNNHLIYYFYGYSTANQKGNPYLNHVRYTLPKNFGKVRAINKNHDIFKYIKIYDEKLIPNYEKHTWVDNEQVTMQKIDHIEKGVNNIGLYYEKPTGWVNEKEWLPTANKTYHSNYGVGVKTISYQDLNRWYNNLGLIDFDDLNEITVWNAIDDISQIEWNDESDEEWVDNFNLVLYDFTTEDNNTLITENGDTMLVLVNERV